MPGALTEITELATALGTLDTELGRAASARPEALVNVSDDVWERFVAHLHSGDFNQAFTRAFSNGCAFFTSHDGLRHRTPVLVEWKGPHRPPGDDVIPADLRIDHVFLVSCKYLSKLLVNCGPQRLFERALVGDQRARDNWFARVAPVQFQTLYEASVSYLRLSEMPTGVSSLQREDQDRLRQALNQRNWPAPLTDLWRDLCRVVACESARRWRTTISTKRDATRLLWRLLRISTATYFVLGSDRDEQLRLRIDSAWDWTQAYELRAFDIEPRTAGQPEVRWRATVLDRRREVHVHIDGHVEVRWSHGRFRGAPEAKVYLDTPHRLVPGYNALV